MVEPEDEAGVAMALLHLFVANNKESILLRNFIRRDVQATGMISIHTSIYSLSAYILNILFELHFII